MADIGTRYDGNVALREITTDDADFMMRLVSDPKATKFIPGMIQEREMLLPQFWQRGYGTEMVNSLVEKARGMGIKELTATTYSQNKAAIRLLEKCGFKKQKNGWMVMIAEDVDVEFGDGQTVLQFWRSI